MARTIRSRRIAATPDELWRVIGDPHHLARWWPGVTRVEDVQRDRFTLVVRTKQGKPMRLDLRVAESTPPTHRSWSQEVAGTPFERLLLSWVTTVTVEPDGDDSRVTIEEHQQLKGSFRLGSPLQRRPARKRIDAALAGLAALTEH
jgi:uncharacterized protein YndB with AHSA1/START domain